MDADKRVLVVDDDAAMGKVLGALLAQDGLRSKHVLTGAEALADLDAVPFDLLVTDLRMPGMDGMALLAEVARRRPELPVIVLTAHGTVPLAVEAMKAGAADFVLKPFDRAELLYIVRKAIASTEKSVAAVPVHPAPEQGMHGDSEAMREVHSIVRRIAPGTSTVLVLGESGTGKELVARAIHDGSPRRSKPFIKLNCGSVPDDLLESELFGYEKGAFTGAVMRKPGRFELAHEGTIFLDEIGDVTPMLQVKLLRVLQEREFERLGGRVSVKVDVRIVAATHRDLVDLVDKGKFREDLYYRLNVVPIRLPPLRAREGDIASLARHFAAVHGRAHRRAVTLSEQAIGRLERESWPGNVRQLQNFIERIVVLSESPTIDLADVERELVDRRPSGGASSGDARRLDLAREESERDAILTALDRASGNRTVAARILGLSRRGLYYRLKALGIERTSE